MPCKMHDIIIIGAGPAGLTAAIYARRAEKSVLIIEKETFGGQMTFSPKIENYPGMISVSGTELADKMVEQALSMGAEIELDEATEIAYADNGSTVGSTVGGFVVKCASGEHEARAVIIAAGAKHRQLGVPREDDFVGRGISYCAVCDGAFYAGRSVAVIGGGNSALQEALSLSDLCAHVTIVQNLNFLTGEESLRAAVTSRDNVEVIYGATVAGIITDEDSDDYRGLLLNMSADGTERRLSCDGAFVAIGLSPENTPFESVTSLDEAGYIMSDETCYSETSGIFAAGDCRTKGVRQIATAVADGAAAALGAVKFLS
ncbi:MAG: FAD-dependent oxidoreductase [Clostridia bacterium]|nr:FAD-dependent oxidoreductase [Clostridia bacterium]